ncbi:MAG TPA: hypothetical protein VG013_04935 [Gemmataceae bacterium]|jgi:hypothetical protein|nr:hypothetical protein [Gemmataceae bacterium]
MIGKRMYWLAALVLGTGLLAPAGAGAGGCYSPLHYWAPAWWRVHARITYGPIAPQYAGDSDFFPVGYRVTQWPCPYVAPAPMYTNPNIVPPAASPSGTGGDQAEPKAKP